MIKLLLDCREILFFVNYVSNAIVKNHNKIELLNENYHIVNSNKISFTKLGEYLNSLGYKVNLTNIDDFLDYLYGMNNTVFYIQSDKTENVLKRLNFEWNKVELNNMKSLLEYCKNIQFI